MAARSITPGTVLIDTSALFALLYENDRFHGEAQRLHQALLGRSAKIFITNYVLVEFQALSIRRSGYYNRVVQLVEFARHRYELVWLDEDLHWSAWQLMMDHWPRLSFVDATSVIVARELGCAVFTFDNDFRQEGLPVIP